MKERMEDGISKKAVDFVAERAQRSGFGNPDKFLIVDLYWAVKMLVEIPALCQPPDPLSWLKTQTELLDKAARGSGLLFNLQGLMECPNVSEAEKRAIQRIFMSISDSRDLHFRYGPCSGRCYNQSLIRAFLSGISGRIRS